MPFNEEKLQEKWPKMPQKKKQTKAEKKKAKEIGGLRGKIERQYGTKAVFTTGPNGMTCTSVDELTQDLLQRDCEKLFNFDGKKSAGATTVPEVYVPMKANIVQPEREEEVLENCPDERKDKLVGEFKATKADLVEQGALNTVVTYQIQEVAGELFENEDFASHLSRLRVWFSNRFRPEIQKKPNLYK